MVFHRAERIAAESARITLSSEEVGSHGMVLLGNPAVLIMLEPGTVQAMNLGDRRRTFGFCGPQLEEIQAMVLEPGEMSPLTSMNLGRTFLVGLPE